MTCSYNEDCLDEPHASCYGGYCPVHCEDSHGGECLGVDDDFSDVDTNFTASVLQGMG